MLKALNNPNDGICAIQDLTFPFTVSNVRQLWCLQLETSCHNRNVIHISALATI